MSIAKQGVSIVVCSHCHHDHRWTDATLCSQETEQGICGCTDYHPVLVPFVHAQAKPKPKGESPLWIVVAFTLLALLAWWAERGGQ